MLSIITIIINTEKKHVKISENDIFTEKYVAKLSLMMAIMWKYIIRAEKK